MAKSNRDITKSSKKVRPSKTGAPVLVRFQDDLLLKLDNWRRRQDDLPNRAEAVRRIINSALK